MSVSCFIRKNTPELREKLEAMGYKQLNVKDNADYIFTGGGQYSALISNELPIAAFALRIDCDDNEALFLDLAGMREDTDKGQLFTNGKQWMRWSKSASVPALVIVGFHRATPQEIVEYHKGKEK